MQSYQGDAPVNKGHLSGRLYTAEVVDDGDFLLLPDPHLDDVTV
jgi:hypothetical protein